MLHLENKTFD